MKRTFGQFKARVLERSNLPPEDARIVRAFQQGEDAGRACRAKSECGYAPHSEEERWQAWMIGYEETYERYVPAGNAPE